MMKVVYCSVPFIVWLLLLAGFVRPAHFGRLGRWLWAGALLLIAAKYVAFGLLGGAVFSPELPEALILVWNWALVGMILLLLLCVPGRLVARRQRIWLLPLLAWGMAAYGIWSGLRVPEVVTRTVQFANLPDSLVGYRILQISDIHASPAARRWRTQAIVDKANAAGADLICLTGDYADGKSARQRANIEPIRELRARDGVYAVSGNHEYYFDWQNYAAMYRAWGLEYLANRCVFPHAGLALGGVNDVQCTKRGLAAPDVAAAFRAATNGEFRVLLQHRPHGMGRHLPLPVPVDFQLSGHTHGGIAPVISALAGLRNEGFVRGLYEPAGGAAKLFVSPGIGMWAGFPVRYNVDAEMTLFVLEKR